MLNLVVLIVTTALLRVNLPWRIFLSNIAPRNIFVRWNAIPVNRSKNKLAIRYICLRSSIINFWLLFYLLSANYTRANHSKDTGINWNNLNVKQSVTDGNSVFPPLYSAVADTFSGILQLHWLHGTDQQVEENSFAYLSRWNFSLLSEPLKCDWRISFSWPNMGLGYDVVM